MTALLVGFHVLVCVLLIGLILMQQGKGADVGAAFGSGASSTIFGARGSATFLSRTTAWLVAIFFVTSLLLAYIVTSDSQRGSVVTSQPPVSTEAAPQESKPADVPSAK